MFEAEVLALNQSNSRYKVLVVLNKWFVVRFKMIAAGFETYRPIQIKVLSHSSGQFLSHKAKVWSLN